MAFIDDLADLLTDTCSWQPLTSRGRTGQPTYGSSTPFSCRLVQKTRMVRDTAGDEVVSSCHVVIKGTPNVQPEDKVTLSTGGAPTILAVERPGDETGLPAYTRIYFR